MKAAVYILSANLQALSLIIFFLYASDYLDEGYPQSFSWKYVLLPTALAASFYVYYQVFRVLMRLERRRQEKEGDHDPKGR